MIMHAELYRYKNGTVEFLILKRTPEDGGFWQPVTGTLEDGEKVLNCLHREIREETGISSVLHVSDQIYQFDWDGDIAGRDLVYAVEVAEDAEVILDGKEHTEYRWLPLFKALEMLKYQTIKTAMNLVNDYILQREIQPHK